MKLYTILPTALLVGCGSAPTLDGTGTYTCVTVDGLTAKTTTVHINLAQGGTAVVQPDCSAVLQVQTSGVAL